MLLDIYGLAQASVLQTLHGLCALLAAEKSSEGAALQSSLRGRCSTQVLLRQCCAMQGS